MTSHKRMILDRRLSEIAELVGQCECMADIGCDHGRLGAYLLQRGQCQRAWLTDISEPSLQKARRLIGLLGLNDRVTFSVGDGAKALREPVDCAVIAGMGGDTIATIVREGQECLSRSRLILQPNVDAPKLRAALCDCGYGIVDERVVQDGGRNYVIIAAETGEAHYTERELIVGPVLLNALPDALKPYAAFRLRVANKALMGAEIGGDSEQADALRHEIAIWEEVRACLQR